MSKQLFHLYVVELDPAVRQHGRVRKENPQGDDRCVYVGSTAHAPEHRLAQHKQGVHANRGYVTEYGRDLRKDLAGGSTYSTRPEAEAAERALAEQLRKEGYTVWQR